MDLSDYCLCGFVYFCLLLADLTPQRTASGHTTALQIEQSPNVAAMRWRGWFGGASRCLSYMRSNCVIPILRVGVMVTIHSSGAEA
jgi:hypothetical protein